MKILQVITTLLTGGAEKLIVDMVPKMRAAGHEVDVCLFDGTESPFKEKLAASGCRIYDLSIGGSVYNPLLIRRLRKVMRGYDIVHTHNTTPQFFAAMAGRRVLRSMVLCTTEHSTSTRRRDWWWYPRAMDRWMYNKYSQVVCISDQARDNLMENIGHTKAEVSVIYNGVDVQAIHEAKPCEELAGNGLFNIVMVAGFRYQKDQDTLIRAMAKLPADRYHLWLVGDGTRRGELEALIAKEGLTDRVTLMGLRTDVPSILRAADVVVMSSHFEGLSLSNLEGMAAGKPFVASDVDGLREVTKGYGVLFPHGDDAALAEVISQLSSDRRMYSEVAERCYERALQYDIGKTVEGYLKIYAKTSL